MLHDGTRPLRASGILERSGPHPLVGTARLDLFISTAIMLVLDGVGQAGGLKTSAKQNI